MSLFLVSNNQFRIEKACKIWVQLGFSVQSYEVGNGVYVALSSGYKSRPVFFERSDQGCFFSVGTYFTEKTFDAKTILSEKKLYNFDSKSVEGVFGHYVFFTSSSEGVRIVTDPVGLIGVYHSSILDEYCVGNDLLVVAGAMGVCDLSGFGAQQFVINENTVGTETVFSGVKRLGLGKELCILGEGIQERAFHNLTPEKMKFDEYVGRVSSYFKALNNYTGIVAAEASAGFDTRLVAACAKSSVDDFLLITNQNQSDHGVDEEVSKILAKKLGLPLVVVKRPDKPLFNDELLLHIFSVGRDIVRSAAWGYISSEKYKAAGLILGGYGGEAIRAKYCKYKDVESFACDFYKGIKISDPDQRRSFIDEILNQIKAAGLDTGANSKETCNRIYALDRMRTWGGAATLAMMIYGDRLHPFMDWYLLGPLLSFSDGAVQEEKLQEKLIEYFSPGLMSIAVNPVSTLLIDGEGRLKNKVFSRGLWMIRRLESKVVQLGEMFFSKFNTLISTPDLSSADVVSVSDLVGLDFALKPGSGFYTRILTLASAVGRVKKISSDGY